MDKKEVLVLDIAGTPREWIPAQTAAVYYAKNAVVYALGVVDKVFVGGYQRSGRRSMIEVSSIIAVRGPEFSDRHYRVEPLLSNSKLFTRDRYICAYCAERFPYGKLSREHITPVARGGADSWMNLVTACRSCNTRKASKLPHEANMQLVYLPYIPSRWEDFILSNRNIKADQMEYLLAKVPATSRMHS